MSHINPGINKKKMSHKTLPCVRIKIRQVILQKKVIIVKYYTYLNIITNILFFVKYVKKSFNKSRKCAKHLLV